MEITAKEKWNMWREASDKVLDGMEYDEFTNFMGIARKLKAKLGKGVSIEDCVTLLAVIGSKI